MIVNLVLLMLDEMLQQYELLLLLLLLSLQLNVFGKLLFQQLIHHVLRFQLTLLVKGSLIILCF